MSDFGDEIRQRVLERLGKVEMHASPEETISTPEPSKFESGWAYMFVGGMFLLSVLVMGTVVYFKNAKIVSQPIAQIQHQPPQMGLTMDQVQSSIRPMFDGQNQKLDDMKRRMDVISHRQWVLGVIQNENACIADSYNPNGQNRYITLDEDWKLSRTPEFLRMSDEDKQRLTDATRR